MQGIVSTSDGRTKNPTGDSEAVQKLTIVESGNNSGKPPLAERAGRGVCYRWEVSAQWNSHRLRHWQGGGEIPVSSLPSPSSPVPCTGWSQLTENLEYSAYRDIPAATLQSSDTEQEKGHERSKGNQPRPSRSLKSYPFLSWIDQI